MSVLGTRLTSDKHFYPIDIHNDFGLSCTDNVVQVDSGIENSYSVDFITFSFGKLREYKIISEILHNFKIHFICFTMIIFSTNSEKL